MSQTCLKNVWKEKQGEGAQKGRGRLLTSRSSWYSSLGLKGPSLALSVSRGSQQSLTAPCIAAHSSKWPLEWPETEPTTAIQRLSQVIWLKQSKWLVLLLPLKECVLSSTVCRGLGMFASPSFVSLIFCPLHPFRYTGHLWLYVEHSSWITPDLASLPWYPHSH